MSSSAETFHVVRFAASRGEEAKTYLLAGAEYERLLEAVPLEDYGCLVTLMTTPVDRLSAECLATLRRVCLDPDPPRPLGSEDCRELADWFGFDQVIACGFSKAAGTTVATWGRSAADKEQAAAGADAVLGKVEEGRKTVHEDFRSEAGALKEELDKWRALGREIVETRFDDVCWTDWYKMVAEMLGREWKPELLPRAVMLRNCEKFVDCLKAGEPYQTPEGGPTPVPSGIAVFETDAQGKPAPHSSHRWRGGAVRPCVACGSYTSSVEAFYRCDPSRLAGKTEPCCDCGADYPRSDLIAGEIYCPACRTKPSNTT